MAESEEHWAKSAIEFLEREYAFAADEQADALVKINQKFAENRLGQWSSDFSQLMRRSAQLAALKSYVGIIKRAREDGLSNLDIVPLVSERMFSDIRLIGGEQNSDPSGTAWLFYQTKAISQAYTDWLMLLHQRPGKAKS